MRIYKPRKIPELWAKILGVQKGTLVLPTRAFIRKNPHMYFPKLGIDSYPNMMRIPTSKFVGVVIKQRGNEFEVRWIAERQDSQERPFFWERQDFTIVGFRAVHGKEEV